MTRACDSQRSRTELPNRAPVALQLTLLGTTGKPASQNSLGTNWFVFGANVVGESG